MHIISFLSRWIARITALTLVTAPRMGIATPCRRSHPDDIGKNW